jgi:hypothetical protein
MGDSPRSGSGPHGASVLFWTMVAIIVVGLALMIMLPLAGR